ncbi:MAG: hypothetical protein Q7K44_00180, partial [Candidatus Liptonbacteria bacterium]|nr:hypothetical protein [Candidatus Liptonbacteria bacterium]
IGVCGRTDGVGIGVCGRTDGVGIGVCGRTDGIGIGVCGRTDGIGIRLYSIVCGRTAAAPEIPPITTFTGSPAITFSGKIVTVGAAAKTAPLGKSIKNAEKRMVNLRILPLYAYTIASAVLTLFLFFKI